MAFTYSTYGSDIFILSVPAYEHYGQMNVPLEITEKVSKTENWEYSEFILLCTFYKRLPIKDKKLQKTK